ncbi:MAG: hypothetical protein K1Y36_24545 [Blastocatellia bacterium]|nr:hypothetical protein [Blastocatellia bacterium]
MSQSDFHSLTVKMVYHPIERSGNYIYFNGRYTYGSSSTVFNLDDSSIFVAIETQDGKTHWYCTQKSQESLPDKLLLLLDAGYGEYQRRHPEVQGTAPVANNLPKPDPNEVITTQKISDFVVEVVTAISEGNKIGVKFEISNEGYDRSFAFCEGGLSKAELVDTEGNTYGDATAKLANQTTISKTCAEAFLINGTKAQGAFVFDNVPTKGGKITFGKITSLKVYAQIGDKRYELRFKNIQISQL